MLTQGEIDQLYHIMRKVSNVPAIDEQEAILALVVHLLKGPSYADLIQFSSYYGERYLLNLAHNAIKSTKWQFSRIIEFGGGLQWLGRGLAAKFGSLPTWSIDKRSWALDSVMLDLEIEQDRTKVLGYMQPNDLIVASDFLHCLEDPAEVMSPFSKWPLLALEYCPLNDEYRQSFNGQLSRYGGNPIDLDDYEIIFPGRKLNIVRATPYIVLLVEAKGGQE